MFIPSTVQPVHIWMNYFKRISFLTLCCLLGLSGCKTLDTIPGGSLGGAPQVGPQSGAEAGTQLYTHSDEKQYTYNSNIFLDVAIPVFDPGLPINNRGEVDYNGVEKQGVWPQLRRAEAKRFSVETKRAIEKLGSFGAVSVVPTASASADVYVLGNIKKSDSETVRLGVTVVDSQGKLWGKQDFTHRVSAGFFRDKTNEDKDPYEPVFNQIAHYVYELLKNKSESEKQTIKTVTDLRYGQLYSPEVFSQHIKAQKTWNGSVQYKLVSLPSERDAMVQRIKPLKVQDQLFIDRLQTHYEGFNAKSDESYRTWQKETLPEIIAYKKARANRNTQVGVGVALATLAVLLKRKADSENDAGRSDQGRGIAATAGVLASAYFIGNAVNKGGELKIHKQSIDELGESLDIELNPQVMTHNEQTVELTGTANEQYQQWKNHLKAIYELEKTPDTQL